MKQLKDALIDGVAEKMKVSRNVVEAVVMDQFAGIAKAMSTETSIEMSGFGVFKFIPKKAEKIVEALKASLAGEKELSVKIDPEDIKKEIASIENQLNKCRK